MKRSKNSFAVAFGKIVFKPPVPDMNLVVFKDDDDVLGYRAVCIHLEIDACGESIDDACKNLKKTLHTYLSHMLSRYKNADDALKTIAEISYDTNTQKSAFFSAYIRAQRDYAMQMIEKNRNSIITDFCKSVSCLFQSGDVRLSKACLA